MIGWNAFVLLATVHLAPVAPALPPSPEQVMEIPAELRRQLHEQVIRPTHVPEQRLQRLLDLLSRSSPDGLRYDADATLTVAGTWAEQRANCLSFTLLLVALAREAGLDARVQEVGQVLGWYQERGVIYNAGHVNAGLRVADRHATLDLDRNVLYDRRGPRAISDRRALAHFYNNRGAELMAAHDDAGARAHFEMALRMDARFAAAWNNLGVLETRAGDDPAAAAAFGNALAIAPELASALSNANALYQRTGDGKRAALLAQRLHRMHAHDPFHQFMQGMEAEREGDYARAVQHYRHAVRLYGSAHQFRFGLARTHFLTGDNRRAMRELARARELGGNEQLRTAYQAKLDSLRRPHARQAMR